MQPRWPNILGFIAAIVLLVLIVRLPDEWKQPPLPPEQFRLVMWAILIGLGLGVAIRLARRI